MKTLTYFNGKGDLCQLDPLAIAACFILAHPEESASSKTRKNRADVAHFLGDIINAVRKKVSANRTVQAKSLRILFWHDVPGWRIWVYWRKSFHFEQAGTATRYPKFNPARRRDRFSGSTWILAVTPPQNRVPVGRVSLFQSLVDSLTIRPFSSLSRNITSRLVLYLGPWW